MGQREIFGYTKDGERVFLGRVEMSDEDVQRFLDNIAEIYGSDGPPVFNVAAAVFDARAFAGVQVLPGSKIAKPRRTPGGIEYVS